MARLLLLALLAAAPLGAKAATFELAAGDARIDIELFAGDMAVSEAELLGWVTQAAESVRGYYERFPVTHLRIRIIPTRGGAVSGTTWGGSTAFIRMLVGSAVSARDLDEDWKLTHEMIHLAFPRSSDDQLWIEEGLATYIEPIARALHGQLSREAVWRRLILGMPYGAQAMATGGLNEARGWGRTYWGGALYALLADIKIREETNLRYGLRDALAGLVAANGNIEQIWATERSLQVADDAADSTALADLYAMIGFDPFDAELAQVWEQLGIELSSNEIRFDDSAPKADIRRAIVSAPVTLP